MTTAQDQETERDFVFACQTTKDGAPEERITIRAKLGPTFHETEMARAELRRLRPDLEHGTLCEVRMITQDKVRGLSAEERRIIESLRGMGFYKVDFLIGIIERLRSTPPAEPSALTRQHLIELAFRASINDNENWRSSIARHATYNCEVSALYQRAEKLADEYLATHHPAPVSEGELAKMREALEEIAEAHVPSQRLMT